MALMRSKIFQTFWREFDWKLCFLEYDKPNDFGKLNLPCRCTTVYVVYRSLVMSLFLGVLIYDFVTYFDVFDRFLMTYTSWSIIILTIHFMLLWAISIWQYLQPDLCYKVMPIGYKISWVLNNLVMSTSTSTPVCIGIFWIAYYLYPEYQMGYIGHPFVLTLFYHGINGLFVLLDCFLVLIPIRICHAWHGLVLIQLYLSFTLVHWLLNKGESYSHIYGLLDWENSPDISLIISLIAVFVVPFSHTIAFACSKINIYFLNKCYKNVCCQHCIQGCNSKRTKRKRKCCKESNPQGCGKDCKCGYEKSLQKSCDCGSSYIYIQDSGIAKIQGSRIAKIQGIRNAIIQGSDSSSDSSHNVDCDDECCMCYKGCIQGCDDGCDKGCVNGCFPGCVYGCSQGCAQGCVECCCEECAQGCSQGCVPMVITDSSSGSTSSLDATKRVTLLG